MKFKKLIFQMIGLLFLILSTTKPISNANKIEHLKNEGNNIVLRMAKSLNDLEDTEDPNEIFSRALNEYIEEFDSYLDITGLNVLDKEAITLPDFDINYVASEYYTIMNEYETSFQSKMSSDELLKYNNFRKENVYFDKHITLIETKYLNLNIRPKFNPTIDIKIPLVEYGRSVELATILAGAGLSDTIISALTGCVTALSSALSTFWIPVIGWTLAVGVAVGSLIALAVMIVDNWDAICSTIDDIKNWFLNKFSMFSELINSFFDDAIDKGEESTIAQSISIGTKTYDFKDTIVTTDVLSTIVDDCKRNDNVWLLGHIGNPLDEKGKHWWICYETVKENFVMANNLYDQGVCTYTWYNNTAKKMMANGSTTIKGDYSLLIYDKTVDQNDAFGWNHYHLGVQNGDTIIRNNTKPFSWAHSFFGLLYINENRNYKTYPTNP